MQMQKKSFRDTLVIFLYMDLCEKPPHEGVNPFEPYLRGFPRWRCFHHHFFYCHIHFLHNSRGDGSAAADTILNCSCRCVTQRLRRSSQESFLSAGCVWTLRMDQSVIIKPVHSSLLGQDYCFEVPQTQTH